MGMKTFYEKVGLTKGIEGKTFIVQGFGAVGYWASHFLHKDGGKITTVVEYNSAIHNPEGFDPDDVRAWMQQHGTLIDYPTLLKLLTRTSTLSSKKRQTLLFPPP